jgi:hypothetical protein
MEWIRLGSRLLAQQTCVWMPSTTEPASPSFFYWLGRATLHAIARGAALGYSTLALSYFPEPLQLIDGGIPFEKASFRKLLLQQIRNTSLLLIVAFHNQIRVDFSRS